MSLHEQQLTLEQQMHDNGIQQWLNSQRRTIEQGSASNTAWNRRLMADLVAPLGEGITAYLESLKGKRGQRSKGAYILQAMEANVAAFIGIKTLFDLFGAQADLSVYSAANNIGRRIEDNIRFTKLEDAAPKYIERVKESLKKAFSHSYSHQTKVMSAAERRVVSNAKSGEYAIPLDEWVSWTSEESVQVGLLILDIAHSVLTINGEDVFEIDRGARGATENATIRQSLALSEWCYQFKEEVSRLFPSFAPCVVPPRDWVSPFDGGYHSAELAARLPLVKSGRIAHRKKLTRKQMPRVYQAVNFLQHMQWRVNSELLATVEDIMQSGKQLAMPSRVPYESPASPVDARYSELRGKELKAAMSAEEWDQFLYWKSEARKVHEEENTRRASLKKFSDVVGQARSYSGFDVIYFVWNLDSRGRVYCNSSRLSPQGEDICKALIIPAQADPLGKRGRYWLAVHGANTWAQDGIDKDDFDARAAWADKFTEDILDYAAMPSVFTDWTNADKPWQFLAWCQDWARLIAFERNGGHSEAYESAIPVAMDGSCSGLQHYSAMLRDEVGGKFVNLMDSDKPQDIYGEVARVTLDKLNLIMAGAWVDSESLKDANQKELAAAWVRFGINRNLCKKPVMTLPYGATMLTARESIEGILTEREKEAKDKSRKHGVPYVHPHEFGEQGLDQRAGLTLVTSCVWSSIGEIVRAARVGMDYIRAIARAVANENKALVWTTPTGFIVEQFITEYDSTRIDTCLLGNLRLRSNVKTKVIDVNGMLSAAAPNFIHSYDASHLALVCCAAKDVGINSVACIHDSFGASAGRTEELRNLLRDTFVDMYHSDAMANLKKDAEESALVDLSKIAEPRKGNLNLQDIRESKYCFS